MKLGELRTTATAMPILLAVGAMFFSVCTVLGAADLRPLQASRVSETDTPPPTPLLADDKVLRA